MTEPWMITPMGPDGRMKMQHQSAFATSFLESKAALDYRSEPGCCRLSGLICTLGPASNTPEKIMELIEAGMTIARLNFSHGSHEYHASTVKAVRKAAGDYAVKTGVPCSVAIALDTKGPEIRTGLLQDGPSAEVYLEVGNKIRLTTDPSMEDKGTSDTVFVDYKNITSVLSKGDTVFVDDGLISLKVEEIGSNYVECVVESEGKLSSRKGVNLPGVPVDLPSVSEKDKSDLQFGVEQEVDMIFASFIRSGAALKEIRDVLGSKGKNILVISKVENAQGMDNIDEIIEASDGVMVARGDLGIEIPAEKVAIAQKTIIARCNLMGKPVICATQMLDSMTQNPRPTRAEVSDVANAVWDGADCVMLSGESAKGHYPALTVRTMSNICREAEAAMYSKQLYNELIDKVSDPVDPTMATALAAVLLANRVGAACLVVVTHTGKSACCLARLRPRCPVIAVTRCAQTARHSNLHRAILPLLYQVPPATDWQKDVDLRVQFGISFGRKKGFVQRGSALVLVTGWKPGAGFTNTVRIMYASGTEE